MKTRMNLLISIILFTICTQKLFSTVIIVPDDYQDIQTAINSASVGDTVLIKPGLYEISTTIDLKQGVTLFGYGADSTILEGNSSIMNSDDAETGSIIIARDLTNISFLHLKSAGMCGIYLRGVSEDIQSARITQNLFTDCKIGINFNNRYKIGTLWIINNTLVNCIEGISDNDWNIVNMYNNMITYCDYGVKKFNVNIWNADYNNVYNCSISNWSGMTPSDKNLSVDPIFKDVLNNNFHLSSNSPCINAGNPDTVGFELPAIDYSGNSRINFGRIDIGVFEAIEYDPTNIRNNKDINDILVYPNPARDMINISFGSMQYKTALIKISDMSGKLISSVTYHNLSTATIDLSGNPKGIYMLNLNIDGEKINKKICID